MHTEWTFSSVNLRDFDTVLIFFSEEEIEELQAAIDKRRSRRPARHGEDCPALLEQPVYSSNVRGEEFSEVRMQDY